MDTSSDSRNNNNNKSTTPQPPPLVNTTKETSLRKDTDQGSTSGMWNAIKILFEC